MLSECDATLTLLIWWETHAREQVVVFIGQCTTVADVIEELMDQITAEFGLAETTLK